MLYPNPISPEAATRFLSFVNASPTPFHAVHNAIVHLEKAGFEKVLEKVRFVASAPRLCIDLPEGRLGGEGPARRQILFHAKPGVIGSFHTAAEVEG